MRTDSTRISDDALTAVRAHITESYGAEYLPETVNTYGNKERAQDAHEAIRPTLMEWPPEKVAAALANHPEGNELVKLCSMFVEPLQQLCVRREPAQKDVAATEN